MCLPQDVLGNAGIRLEFHHLIGCVLSIISAAHVSTAPPHVDMHIMLEMVLKLLGWVCPIDPLMASTCPTV